MTADSTKKLTASGGRQAITIEIPFHGIAAAEPPVEAVSSVSRARRADTAKIPALAILSGFTSAE